ncbi:hypothetical protein GCM10007874_28970 [Labrys miyagiensis]|uniref:Uncharacterized protein n=1 Tax=Labrys miyagiensis TaxID=346912 RepID=A0ABQ6CIA9_9HYPH|nr:hypothetical protein GCM10007874_28970 [Labrys miyagiensis]
MGGKVGVLDAGANDEPVAEELDLLRECGYVDQQVRLLNTFTHQVDQVGATREIFGARMQAEHFDRICARARMFETEDIHAAPSDRALCTASTMPLYAPQRQIFPLMRS